MPLHGYELQFRRYAPEIAGIARGNRLALSPRAHHHVCIRDIGRSGAGQQKPNSSCIRTVKRSQVRSWLPDQAA